jgi:hypothetical protein
VLNSLGLISRGFDIGGKEIDEELFEACNGLGFGCRLLILLPEKRIREGGGIESNERVSSEFFLRLNRKVI